MIKNWQKILAITFLTLGQQPALHAQTNTSKFEAGIMLSAFVYQGDLTPKRLGSYETLRPGINLHGSLIMSRSFSLRTNLALGSLRGDDAKYAEPAFRQQRNFNFSSPVVELSELLVWNPLGKNYAEKGISVYVFAGAGVSFLSVKRDWSKFNPAYFPNAPTMIDQIAEDEATPTPSFIPVMPAGGGIRFSLTRRMAVNLESAYRFTFTDYIDGFSKGASPGINDHYQTISAGLSFKFGDKDKLDCPAVRY